MFGIKLVCFCLSLTLIRAEYLYGHNPYLHYGEYAAAYDNYKPRDYKFEYGVSDPHTGDHKSQWEVKENGIVRGSYSLLEPDGTMRVVDYYADDTGFHADVKKLGHAVHPQPHYGELHPIVKPHIADSIVYNGYGHGGLLNDYGAPIAAITKVAAPIVPHIAPIAQVEHVAPVQQVIAPGHQQIGPVLQEIGPVHQSPLIQGISPHIHHAIEPQIHHLGTPIQQEYPQHIEGHNLHYIKEELPLEYQGYVSQAPIAHLQEPIHVTHAPSHEEKLLAPILQEPSPFKIHVPEAYSLHQEVTPNVIPQRVHQVERQYLEPYNPSPVVPVKVAPKIQNPLLKFLAPFAKYFQVPKVTKVAPTAHLAPIGPSPLPPVGAVSPSYNVIYPHPQIVNYESAYQHKPEVILGSHNYAPLDYNNHAY